ncbi:MAG: hypothetical protein N3D78_03145 [Candidatus Aenigmarchaeota archaeon]|nr:hypothetical protein [Candidatus Aenigmarchaeota archaeon]
MKRSFYIKNKFHYKKLLYLLLITILVSFSTVVLHEAGHFLFGMIFGCESVRIVLFDKNFMTTYTEIECNQKINKILVGLSGFFLVLPVSIVLFLKKNALEKYLSIIMIGFNIAISSWDLEKIVGLANSEIIGIIGIVIIAIGEILLVERLIFKHSTLPSRHS